MKRAAALALATLCSCGIDDRTVQVGRTCADAPAGGLIADFSTARAGTCFVPMCPDMFPGSPSLSLGTDGPRGLVFPYRRSFGTVLKIAPTGDLQSISDPAAALQIVLTYDAMTRAPPPVVAGVALQLLDCVSTAGYAGVSFQLSGDLGACPLRFAARFAERGDDPTTLPCPLDECYATTTLAAHAGLNVAPLLNPATDLVFLGLQWELGVPKDGARTCSAEITIDDVRLFEEAPP